MVISWFMKNSSQVLAQLSPTEAGRRGQGKEEENRTVMVWRSRHMGHTEPETKGSMGHRTLEHRNAAVRGLEGHISKLNGSLAYAGWESGQENAFFTVSWEFSDKRGSCGSSQL